ncbi:MAG: hypothetical protein OEM91_11980 [Hyphomicrobiales bacterium]|nr:hypothetical protein [Hyphomicrobiales bacterium]
MKRQNENQISQHKLIKTLLAVMALGTLSIGFILYLFAGNLGFSSASAELIAIVFLGVGAMDLALLLLWDRIFMRGRRPRPTR